MKIYENIPSLVEKGLQVMLQSIFMLSDLFNLVFEGG